MKATKNIIGKQCRNVVYFKNQKVKNSVHNEWITDKETDVHLVKFTEYYEDGTCERKVSMIRDFQKTYWIANGMNRKHKQKKERMLLSQCDTVKSSRKDMVKTIMRKLNMRDIPGQRTDTEEVLCGPYVFGTDLSSSAELKYKFNQGKLCKNFQRFADVAAFDVETNMRSKEKRNHVEMATLSMGIICVTVVDINYLREKYPLISKEDALRELYRYDEIYLGEINRERNITQEFYVVDSEIEVLETIFKRAHEIKPDIISAWNMDFDIRRTIEACKRANIPVKDLLSDPIVPPPLRFFDYNPGKESALTKNGTWKNLSDYEKWPMVNVPASFVFVDSMCYYYNSRKHMGKLPRYKLDYILSVEFPDEIKPDMSEKEIERCKKNSKIRKLKFDESNHLVGTVDWHILMQSKYPFEYVIYNKFDCIALEYLDEQTMDLRYSLGSYCAMSDYKDYDSQPKRLANKFHWFNLERGYAYGTGGKNNEIPLDHEVIGRNDWIVALQADLLVLEGLNFYEDAPNLSTLVFQDNADIDVTSSYPNATSALNTSRETMTKELIEIEGVSEQFRRESGINLFGGFVNSVEITQQLFSGKSMYDVLNIYRAQKNK